MAWSNSSGKIDRSHPFPDRDPSVEVNGHFYNVPYKGYNAVCDVPTLYALELGGM